MKKTISILLSIYLGLFIAAGFISVVDDSLVIFLKLYFLTAISGIFSFLAALAAPGIYVLMGVTVMIPKRVFVPVTLFCLISLLALIPAAIYINGDWSRLGWRCDWVASFCQVILGLAMVFWLRGGWKIRWPLVEEKCLGEGRFSWKNLSLFALANAFILAPAILIYLVLCAVLAVDHLLFLHVEGNHREFADARVARDGPENRHQSGGIKRLKGWRE